MRTRHFAATLTLAAVALVALTLIFSPTIGAGTEIVGPPAALRASSVPRPHRPAGPVAPSTGAPGAGQAERSAGGPNATNPQQRATDKPPRLIAPTPGVSPGSNGVVYLTFDDGPGPYTPDVLRILSQTGSTATFFELGVRRAEFPAMAPQIQAQGNAIGNHTYDHADLTRLTAAKLSAELAGGPSARCVRPPFGASDAAVRAAIHAIGARQVLWSVDTRDWTRPGAAVIAARASGPGVRNGSIVLLHDGGGDRSQTVAALPAIIANLHARGYLVRKLPGC